ncbi:uncharacterized protein LOC108093467 [Drosophila ficusphila]|uniref:uncharacterized protein LOC108093467 n=1 Tax=Drosophila ficusphila TaxID=30025 RepID=UPI0007E65C86|nr:uncharacterized protein LOC108093467 [Drosophila ficusphila]
MAKILLFLVAFLHVFLAKAQAESSEDPNSLKIWLTISAQNRSVEVSWVNAPANEGDQLLVTKQDAFSFQKKLQPHKGDQELWEANGGAIEVVAAIQPSRGLSTEWITTQVPFDYNLSKNVTIATTCYGFWASYIDAEGKILAKSCLKAFPRWMNELRPKVENLRLRDLFIPGSHFAGAYIPNFDLKRQTIMTKTRLAQDEEIKGQLMHGVRYLEVPLVYHRNLFDSYNNDLFTMPLGTILKEISNFVKETNEIVILGIKDFWCFHLRTCDDGEQKLARHLRDEFGDRIVDPSLTWNASLGDIWARKQNVLLTFDDPEMLKKFPELYFQSVEERSGNNRTWEIVETYFRDQYAGLKNLKNARPLADLAVLTATEEDLWYGRVGLRELADDGNRRFSQLYRNELGRSANIVSAEFIRGTTLAETAIQFNTRKTKL